MCRKSQGGAPFLHSPSTNLHPLRLLQNGNSRAAAGNLRLIFIAFQVSFSFPRAFWLQLSVLQLQITWQKPYLSKVGQMSTPLGYNYMVWTWSFSRGSGNLSQRRGHGQVGTIISELCQLQEVKYPYSADPCSDPFMDRSADLGISSKMSAWKGFMVCSSINLEFCRTESAVTRTDSEWDQPQVFRKRRCLWAVLSLS